MTEIDFSATLLDFDGEPLMEAGNPEPLTLRTASLKVLLNDLVGRDGRPEQLDGMAKFANAELARKVHAEDKPRLKAEDLAKIKERIGRAWPAAIVHAAYRLIDGEAE